ncbi:hypothetical protein GGI15_002727 [Coemansia interrupta]|uniref:Ysc84 actin-binding domain-containing protein n=1 Tax=Coemansia interrupta TaxID=1126814 RepID=A0A9W8LKT6_9FUNG|nr:hypothetical protein GGI15_002727 [Coemansia interrupta]
MNFGGNNHGNNSNNGSFAAPSFFDKLRMGATQLQDSFKDVTEQFTLTKECERAARILTEFVVPPKFGGDIGDIIPPDILQHCHGIAVLSIVKAGVIWSGRIGSGIVCARLPNGTWSGPSAIATGGMGVGGQIGAQLTEVVMILNTQDAVRAFEENASLQLGSNLSVTAGPVGRSGEISAAVNTGTVAAVYSYSKSKGLFAGVSVEGSAVLQRKDVNQAFYGRPAPPEMVLSGAIQPPEGVSEWEVLRMVLQERCTPPQGAYGGYPHGQQQQQQHGYPQGQHQSPRPYVGQPQRETLYDQDAVQINAPYTGRPIGVIPPTSNTNTTTGGGALHPGAGAGATGTPAGPTGPGATAGADAARTTSPAALAGNTGATDGSDGRPSKPLAGA